MDQGMVMKPIALSLCKKYYEYFITNLSKNVMLAFCT